MMYQIAICTIRLELQALRLNEVRCHVMGQFTECNSILFAHSSFNGAIALKK